MTFPSVFPITTEWMVCVFLRQRLVFKKLFDNVGQLTFILAASGHSLKVFPEPACINKIQAFSSFVSSSTLETLCNSLPASVFLKVSTVISLGILSSKGIPLL